MLKCNKCATLYEYQAAIKSTKPLSFIPWDVADSLSYRSDQNRDKSKIIIKKKCQGGRKTRRLKSGKIKYYVPRLLCYAPGSHAVRHMFNLRYQAAGCRNTQTVKQFGLDRASWHIT